MSGTAPGRLHCGRAAWAPIGFKFGANDLITEERWFVDTEQWKAAF
jgi:hypothetical protein